MSIATTGSQCERTDMVSVYLVGALPADERREMEAHLRSCPHCQQELQQLQPTVDSLVDWPTDVTRPSRDLWQQLESRIASGPSDAPSSGPPTSSEGPEWEQVAPGIECKLLSTDDSSGCVSMLVRLDADVAYPSHCHAGVEELHLLDGELWIDSRKLYPGDYNRGEPGTGDQRVWSETGCTCVLITSLRDVLR
jgi:anti-sigma factor ChrR (cupin superfamily)